MKENHYRRYRIPIGFCLVMLGMLLCYILTIINPYNTPTHPPTLPDSLLYKTCIDTLYVNPIDTNQTFPDTIFQKYYCYQIAVTGLTPLNAPRVDSILSSRNFSKIRDCDCGNIQAWGKNIDTPINKEERGLVCRNELGQEGDNFKTSMNYVLEIPKNLNVGFENISDIHQSTPQIPSKIKVAVIDTGIDFGQNSLNGYNWVNEDESNGQIGIDDDLNPNCINDDTVGYDFVDNLTHVVDLQGHGTHIAGIITQKEDTPFGVELLDLKILGEEGGDLFNLLCAIQYAIDQKARIINMSLGYYAADTAATLDQLLMQTELDSILVVTSAGNQGYNNDNISDSTLLYHFPSSFNLIRDNVLSVAALEFNPLDAAKLWQHSNHGPMHVDIAAPGENIISTYIDKNGNRTDRQGMLSGTSMAAGYISHIAAILLYQKTDWTGYDKVKQCIIESAKLDTIGGDKEIKSNGMVRNLDILNNNYCQ